MPWLRISDRLEIDTGLITCAEYQLFVDEAGLELKPYHWQGERFFPGTAKEPVTGVKSSQAQAFCHWLTEQHQGLGLNYRLPTWEESQRFPLDGSDLGYWCSHQDKSILAGIDRQQWQTWQGKLKHILELSCGLDFLEAILFLLEKISNIDINLYLILEHLEAQSARETYSHNPVLRARHEALHNLKIQLHSLGRDLVSTLLLVEEIIRELKQAFLWQPQLILDRASSLALEIEAVLVLDADLVMDIDLVKQMDLELQAELHLHLDKAQYLANCREQFLVVARNLARLLSLNLGNQLRDQLLKAWKFEQNVILELDWQKFQNLGLPVEQTLEVVRSLPLEEMTEAELALAALKQIDAKNNLEIIRFCLLLAASSWYYLSEYLSSLGDRKAKLLQQECRQKVDQMLNNYGACVLLTERRKMSIPAWESIRLVRERSN